jgi:hypothetical protein
MEFHVPLTTFNLTLNVYFRSFADEREKSAFASPWLFVRNSRTDEGTSRNLTVKSTTKFSRYIYFLN